MRGRNWKVSKIWLICILMIFGIIVYTKMGESVSSVEKDVSSETRWYSMAPTHILDAQDAQHEIDNIKTIQNTGWKLLMQDGQPVSFHETNTEQNEILERSANLLMDGCYELWIDNDGNVNDILPSKKARQLLEEQHKREQELLK